MRKEGTIVRWNEARGFGFIRSGAVAQEVFLHVRDYRSRFGEAPTQGLRVTFEEILVGGKGPRAASVQPMAASGANDHRHERARAPSRAPTQAASRTPRAPYSGAWWALPLMLAYALGLSSLAWQKQLSWWLLAACIVLNLATFVVYGKDKYAAQQGRWRVKESTLHFFSLIGGWAGAWFAQQRLRHKSAKASFRFAYGFTVMVHCAAVFGLWWFTKAA